MFLLTAYSRKKKAWMKFFKKMVKYVLEKDKIVENLNKFYEKCSKCENVFKKGSPLCAIITPNELLKWTLIEVLIDFETFKMDCHITQKPLKGCYV